MYTAEGIPYMTGEGTRKWGKAQVTVYGLGTGKFNINGEDLRFYKLIQDREQVGHCFYPSLMFTVCCFLL